MSNWTAPTPGSPVTGTVTVPGSKSVTNRALLLAELRRVCREDGTAVLLISHDPVAVASADRVVTVVDGRVAAAAQPVPAG